MPRRFAQLSFTDDVKAVQTRLGTRAHNQRYEASETANTELGAREREFIMARDSFYMATVGQTGWPYVQHRGGAPGFLAVLDAHTLAYADFRGNLQYQSVGNLAGNDRVCLILVDYPQRRRLKLLGRARAIDLAEAGERMPALLDQTDLGGDATTVERVWLIEVEAFDWNCSRHITPRFSARDMTDALIPLQQRIAALEARLRQSGHAPSPDERGHHNPSSHPPHKEQIMKLYDLESSGNCYKVRLFAALAQIPLDIVAVDFLDGAHKRPPLIELNPWGQLPILVDGDLVLRDSQAILVYLAAQYAGQTWFPRDAAGMAQVTQWLSTAANEVQNGPAAARLVDKFGYALDKDDTLRRSARILPLIEAHLAAHQWLALARPTIADCAIFPYVALAPEGGVALADYPHIRQWIERVKALPHFLAMPGI